MNKFRLLLLQSLILFNGAVYAKEKITMGVTLFPPNAMIDNVSNECVGDFITVSKKILAEYAIDIDIICAPPIRIYRFLENGDVDFTINIKSTEALPDDMIFVETPYHTLYLNLYTRDGIKNQKNVAVIRGFGYNGYRQKLANEGYEFIELPTNIAALEVFLRKRSSHLLAYQSPIDYYLLERDMDFEKDITISPLFNITTHYAIKGSSMYSKELLAAFNNYATKHQLTFFQAIK